MGWIRNLSNNQTRAFIFSIMFLLTAVDPWLVGCGLFLCLMQFVEG